jgi:hypothetical protein
MKNILKRKCACGAVEDIREKLANTYRPMSPGGLAGCMGGAKAALRPNDYTAELRVRQFGRLEYRTRFGLGQKGG